MDAPPHAIIWTVDQWVPGLWRDFFDAIWWAYRREPFTVTSWWRSVGKNQQVSGHPDSQHLLGLALDTTLGADRVLRDVGFITVVERDHVHAQVWPAGVARRAGLLAAIGV